MNPCDSTREAIGFCSSFLTEGTRLNPSDMDALGWISPMPDHSYWTHPRWPGVVVVLRECAFTEQGKVEWNHIVSVRVQEQPHSRNRPVTQGQLVRRLSYARGLPPDTLGARATLGRLRREPTEQDRRRTA